MDADYDKKLLELRSKIKSYPDFPKPGILFCKFHTRRCQTYINNIGCPKLQKFVLAGCKTQLMETKENNSGNAGHSLPNEKDIFSAISDGSTSKLLQSLLIQTIKTQFPGVEAVIGLESRGFLFSFSVAAELGIGCLPVRKKGKLPGEVVSYKYDLEYGSDILEIQKNTIRPGLKCLIVDDLIATGGSIRAASKLLQSCGADVIGCLLIIELKSLHGRHNIPNGIPVHSLIKYE